MTNKLVKGAAVIGIAGVIVKFLGAFFRIPLTNWIGDVGMSYYGFAYSIYGALLVLATAGLPVAISRLVSENVAKKHYNNAHKVFKVSVLLMFTIGMISFAICFFGSEFITEKLGNPDANFAVKAIAPALLFVPILSAFRGYFQGRQNMNPTALSEISEQTIRVIVGLAIASFLLKDGLEMAAAGASFGASAGAFGGLLVMFTIYMLNRKVIKRKISLNNKELEDTKVILKKIIVIAVPIIIGSEIMPVMNLIDMSIIMSRLQAMGWSYVEAKAMFGLINGFCSSLISFPQIFTQAVAISLVPAIARAAAVKDQEGIEENVPLGYRTTMIMAFPCAIGIFALAKPILFLLYPMQKESAAEAAPTLMIMAIGVIALAISQTATGTLQAIGKQNIPVKNLLIGCIAKVIITYILVGVKALNIKGAAIGTIVAYVIDFTLNNRAVRKYTGVKIDFNLTYVRPFLASAVMGISAFAVHALLAGLVGNSIATLVAIIIGAVVYAVLIFVFRAITIDELKLIPGGAKFEKIVRKIVK